MTRSPPNQMMNAIPKPPRNSMTGDDRALAITFFHFQVKQVAGFFLEPVFLEILEIENLDDLAAAKRLVQKRIQFRHGFLGPRGKPPDSSAENQNRIKCQGQDNERP